MGKIDDIRNVLQDFTAPELRELRGRMDGIDSRVTAVDRVMEPQHAGIIARLQSVESRGEFQFAVLSAKIDAVFGRLQTLINSLSWEQRLPKLESERLASKGTNV